MHAWVAYPTLTGFVVVIAARHSVSAVSLADSSLFVILVFTPEAISSVAAALYTVWSIRVAVYAISEGQIVAINALGALAVLACSEARITKRNTLATHHKHVVVAAVTLGSCHAASLAVINPAVARQTFAVVHYKSTLTGSALVSLARSALAEVEVARHTAALTVHVAVFTSNADTIVSKTQAADSRTFLHALRILEPVPFHALFARAVSVVAQAVVSIVRHNAGSMF